MNASFAAKAGMNTRPPIKTMLTKQILHEQENKREIIKWGMAIHLDILSQKGICIKNVV